jgi:glyoxylase-like metal-dependent hydrolase (beta-lactamase superfamily II)
MSSTPIVHRYAAGPAGAFVNAYLVEGENGVVAVDGTLTVSDGRALRARLEATGKPLLAVLVTHAHPDHYGGIGELVAADAVPIVASAGTDGVIRRDDDEKERILRPMFGAEWPAERTFPNQTAADGETLSFDGLTFTLLDIGPGESPHDGAWLLGGDQRTVFAGDQAYNHMHGYLADGFYERWLANIERLRGELPGDATLHFGHGEPASPELLDWQAAYIRAVVDAVAGADWSEPERAKAEAVAAVKRFLPGSELDFLMELSVEPLARQLGLLEPSRR